MARHIRYYPPLVPDALERDRLLSRLSLNAHKQIVLITGQAAQGKTTLAASYFQKTGKPVVWVQLTPEDQDHAKLFDKLSEAVRSKAGARASRDRDIQSADLILGTPAGVLRHSEVLMSVFENMAGPLHLVMDDFEVLKEGSSGFELIRTVVETGFDNLRLFILSRSVPGLCFARQKMANRICILDNEDLSFTWEETRQYISRFREAQPDIVDKIHAVTDGWVGGMTLIAASSRSFSDDTPLPGRLNEDVFDYFSQEIYQRVPGDIQRFLIRTAVLDTVDPVIAEHLFSAKKLPGVFNELEKQNLFVQHQADGRGRVRFKYHDLFKKFLLRELERAIGEKGVAALYLKIGNVFWDRHEHERAMTYYTKAGAVAHMERVIKVKGTDYLIRGKLSGLSHWILNLPAERIERDPWLLFFHTMTQRIHGGKKNIKRFETVRRRFEEQQDIRGSMLSLGFLIEAAVFVRQPSQIIHKWISRARSLLYENRADDRFPWAKAILWQHIGLGYIAGVGNLSKGVSACRNAIVMGQQIDTPNLSMNAAITMTYGYVQAGDFNNARQQLSRIRKITSEAQNPEYRALNHIVNINFYLKSGQFDAAASLIRASESDIEKFGLIFLYPGLIEARSLYLAYTGRFEGARQMADHLYDFSILEGNDFYQGISARIKSLIHLLKQEYADAKIEIEKAFEWIDPEKKGDIHFVMTRQIAGIIRFRAGELKGAAALMEEVFAYFDATSSDQSYAETCLVLGLIYWETGEKQKGLTHLKMGFDRAESGGISYFPLIPPRLWARCVIILTMENRIQSFSAYYKGLISKVPAHCIHREMERGLKAAGPRPKGTLLARLKPVYFLSLPKLYIETMGRFDIFLGGAALDKKVLGGGKPLQLLKAMVFNGGNDIPKEVLIHHLWPEVSTAAGEKNFKINLHRLRKAIEPDPQKGFGYSYVLLKSGRVSLNPLLVSLDTDRFTRSVVLGGRYEKQQQFEKAVAQYETACSIYKGDYFQEEPYLEWMERKREHFRAQVLEVLKRKALLHEDAEQTGKAIETWHRALEVDPLFETAFQNLMILYADSGQKQKAVACFEQFEKRVQSELGTTPEKQTLEILNQIIRKQG